MVRLMASSRRRSRVIEILRCTFPDQTWTYDHKRSPHWQSEKYGAKIYSHISDADQEIFQNVLHVVDRWDDQEIFRMSVGRPYHS